jgi:hypothetical protein
MKASILLLTILTSSGDGNSDVKTVLPILPLQPAILPLRVTR